MDLNADNENYWNRSSGKAFSFDDEDCDDDKDVNDDNDVECNQMLIAKKHSMYEITNDDILSEINFDYGASGSTTLELNLTIETFVTEETLKSILDEQIVVDRYAPMNLTLENEVKLLRQQIQNTLYSPAPEKTVRKLQIGKAVNLESYKSLQDKEQLLDTCLRDGCPGDAVIYILLHLEKTLNKHLLYRILENRPIALNHYLSYLELHQQQHKQPQLQLQPQPQHQHQQNQNQDKYLNRLYETLKAVNKYYEAFLLRYHNTLNITNINERKICLTKLLNEFSQHDGVIPQNVFYQQNIKAALQLCELLENFNCDGETKNMNATPIEILYDSCTKSDTGKDKNSMKYAPLQVAELLQIPQGQFQWTVLNERAKTAAYVDLEQIFECTSIWSPMKQKQFQMHISIEWVVLRLFELNAPNCVLYKFLSRMSNISEKLALAEKVKCTKAVIDALVCAKDIDKLLKLYDTLPTRTEEYFYCEKALKNIQCKRWTFGVPSNI